MMMRLAAALVLALAAASSAALEINTASQAELEQLRGIGVTLAERMLDERAKAPFADWADLRARVPGVGSKQAARLSDAGLRVAGQPYAK
jgi:competence protein ComEA